MERPVRSIAPWIATTVALALGLAAWNSHRETNAVRGEAESLLTPLTPDARISLEEYAALKRIAVAESRVRVELARLSMDRKYADLRAGSTELLGRNIVGFDIDGEVSRELVEELICKPLERASATASANVPLYLVPWLNPVELDSNRCAAILTSRVITSDPGTFIEGAHLLALVLGQLAPEQAAEHVNVLVDRIAVAHPSAVKVLFAALRHVDHWAFAMEFARAVRTLTERIDAAESPIAISSLADALDSLAHEVAPEQLVPLLDAIIDRMLAQRDRNLTRDIFFTLMDLKAAYPQTSFGARADYLMRGINVYRDAIEIYDYSEILRLDEQYPKPEQQPLLAMALLSGIRGLAQEDYVSRIWPYCQRFIETGSKLQYADFLDGIRLLVTQMANPYFIFQRPCLLDSGIVDSVQPEDRPELAALVGASFADMTDATPLSRIIESVELLDLLGGQLTDAQLDRVAAGLAAETDTYQLAAAAHSLATSDLVLPPEFYPELFVLVANAVATVNRQARLPLALAERLPESQRDYLIRSSVEALSTQLAPEVLASRAELLRTLKPWLSKDDLAQVATAIAMALEDSANVPVFSRLASAFMGIDPRADGNLLPRAREAHLRHLSASNERPLLAELFRAADTLRTIGNAGEPGQETLRAAAVRFLEQIVPADAGAPSVRQVLAKPSLATEPSTPISRASQMRRSQRITLQPDDVKRIAERYVAALLNARVTHAIADYATSIETLADYSRPGELGNLLQALRMRLDSSADMQTHPLLVSAWVAVEKSTNAQAPAAERMPLYLDVLQLPLTSDESRGLLLAEAETILGQELRGDFWKLAEWGENARE